MKKKKLWIFIRNCILCIISIFALWVSFHHVMTAFEKKKYSPIGELVEVDGKNMHVYTKGKGDNPIVLLSGLGTPAPMLDFEPLIDEMAKHHQVVVVEPFGYGWSEITDKKRTVENIVEEIRLALQKSNIDEPYTLMAHSISGIYSMYFANQYPDEVSAIIGIDATLPKATEYFDETPSSPPGILRFVAVTGITRLATYVLEEDIVPIAESGTYSEDNLHMMKAITAWKGYNKNVMDEANEIEHNIEKTKSMAFPSNLPVLFFTTKEDELTDNGKNNITFYQTQLTKNTSSTIKTFDGHHYLHWTHYKAISEYLNEFISNINE
ncbi:alpha/beta fold hydrolase [Paucisalibacillus sp. EB02]|uniref:alpha/beta fold hydrolase n=1 Tax=Paucisalibacillus sp. EB02 TaxID=1347087 RepID=UPI0018CC7414|nr:alpha/beta hydrolase [Paucisalibacillus sp. EB02]